jgi:exoribonuclease II
MALTKAEIEAKKLLLVEYLAAEVRILKTSQSYTIKDRTYDRANLKTLQTERRKLEKEIHDAERGGKRVRLVMPRDD